MAWMKKHDPAGKLEIFPEKFEMIYGDLVHKWTSGRLTIILKENEDIHSKTDWIEQSEFTFFSTKGGYVMKIISNDEYYIDEHAPAGVFREYFKKMEH